MQQEKEDEWITQDEARSKSFMDKITEIPRLLLTNTWMVGMCKN